jgi:hypothetical protein
VLENKGKVLAKFRVVDENGVEGVSKPWLHVAPQSGSLVPGGGLFSLLNYKLL